MLVSSAGALVRVDLAEIVVHCDFQKRFVGIPLRVGILWVMYSKLGFWRSMFNKTLRRLLPDALPLKRQPPVLDPNLDHLSRMQVIESKWRPSGEYIS